MISERAQRMVDDAPDYYQESAVYQDIQEAKAQELALLEEKQEDLRLQLNPQTATWGLVYYEKQLKIIPAENATLEDRRSNVISRMRGIGNFSAEQVRSVAESFTNGQVEVTVDVANYLVNVKFISNLGPPPKLDDLKAAIENIIHAHMGVEYRFRYLTVTEVQGMTINQLQTTPLNNFAPFLEILA